MRNWIAFGLGFFVTWLQAAEFDKQYSPLSFQNLVETGGGLVLILLMIIGGAWLYKRYAQLPTMGKGLIKVLGGVSLGPRERVVMLQIENTRLLVGVTPGQVRTLHVMDDQVPGNQVKDKLSDVQRRQNES
jgi:flagellar protein FliO/FliZ